MKIKTIELTGAALDWAVAKAECHESFAGSVNKQGGLPPWSEGWLSKGSPSQDWSIGGPLIEERRIGLSRFGGKWQGVMGNVVNFRALVWSVDGPTPLVAAMRALVASKLGDEIEVPDELAQQAETSND